MEGIVFAGVILTLFAAFARLILADWPETGNGTYAEFNGGSSR